MGPPPGQKPKHKGKALIAGGLSGAFEICCTYPTEYVKTVSQLSSKNLGVRSVINNTFQNNGFLGFYRGLSSMLVFAAPKAATRFTAFEFFNDCLKDSQGRDKYGLGSAQGFVAGLGAGTMEAILVTTPQETIKIKLIHDQFKSEVPRFNGLYHGVTTIVKENGFNGVYRGVMPTILKVSTAQATRFGVFHMLRQKFTLDTPMKNALAGGSAGAISVLLFQGIDVVKSRMQGLEAARYRSSLDCFNQILRNEGPLAFYKGVAPRLTRVTLEVAITMTIYGEIVKLLDSVWNTNKIEIQDVQPHYTKDKEEAKLLTN